MAYGSGGGSRGPKREIIFHSALVELGPVRVTVDAEPRYLKNKDRDVVELTVKGDKVLYWCENESCAEFWKGQNGRTFTIIAEGSKAGAVISYVGEQAETAGTRPAPSTPPPPPAQHAAPPTSRGAPPPPTNGKKDAIDKLLHGMTHAGRLGVALQLAAQSCLNAAEAFLVRNGSSMTPEIKLGTVNHLAESLCDGETIRSLLIQMDRSLLIGELPNKATAEMFEHVKERVAAKAKKAAAPPPPPPPPPAPEPAEPEEDDVPY